MAPLKVGHENQSLYLTRRVPASPGRILEVGARDYGNTQRFREHYGGDYVGLDLEPGPRVDVVHDLMEGLGPLAPASFDLIICCSVLEHVRRPWVVAATLTELLRPGGTLYVAVPWVWRFHGYPDDYWRISWRGLEEIFPALAWRDFTFSTSMVGDFIPCAPGADDARARGLAEGKYLPYLEIHGLGVKQ